MAKSRTEFICQQCGRVTPRAMGKCPGCGAWNSMLEQAIRPTLAAPAWRLRASTASTPRRLTEIDSGADQRLRLPIEELARVLGGGVVPGSVVLVGGDPGIGKSTLLLQLAAGMAAAGPVLYVSGEESERQIKMRAERLSESIALGENLFLVTESDLDSIEAHITALRPLLVVVDSIQTVHHAGLASAAGTVSQVREAAARLQALAKATGSAVFLVGHVTKEGLLAGPRVLEHIVDTVLYLEGARDHGYRLLRCVKNRFGATSEVGVFEMQEHGMVEVPNPSEAFLAERWVNAPGSAIAVTLEGTRPLLVEIQGLTSPTAFGAPRRTPNGVDMNRLQLVTAVLTKRLGLRLSDQDVFVNVVGGLRVDEPAVDLSVAAALASSLLDRPVAVDVALVGEVGLSGELRAVRQLPLRLKEARELGFRRVVAPKSVRRNEPWPDGLQVVQVRSLREALDAVLV